MKYMMLVVVRSRGSNEPPDPAVDQHRGLGDQARRRWQARDRRAPPPAGDRHDVRRRGGELLDHRWPVHRAREWIAGFDILECDDLDEAIAIAAAHPMSAAGALELRPFWPSTRPEHERRWARRRPIDVRRALADAMSEQRLRIVASLIRTTGDWDLAEDAVSDAAERALLRWPVDGIPDNPAAWLTATARRRAIDVLRRAQVERGKLADLAALEELTDVGSDPSPMGDDRLRLVFTCCHPALPLEARVALTLKVVSGLSTEAIGRAFLTSEATMGQRLLRAKNKIAHAGIPYRVPSDDLLPERIDGVLAVVYLVFTEGYATAARSLADEAIRLGRLLVALMPDSDETRALLALMLLQHARRDAREVDERAGDPRAPGPLAGGIATRSTRRWHCCVAGGRCAARTPSRPTSPRLMRPLRQRRRRTGQRSLPCTTSCSTSPRRRSSPSTGPSRSA